MIHISRYFEKRHNLSIIFLIIPLALSAFTHLWNPIGFPAFHVDEGHYMRRAMQVIQGLGPQESKEIYDYGYDHPYFGQIFLAAALSLVNYPHSLNPSINSHSIEMLYLVPRVLIGILAVVDTFLVYKISETRYNRKVAFISATLFAVMPLSWFLRGIFLDSIQLPFLLLSILFAVYYAKSESHYSHINGSNKNILLILLSGIFLGLAIFTKIPVFTMIPLIAFIILKKENKSNSNNRSNSSGSNIKTSNRLKALGIWFVPVILIPIIWPAYAISLGQFDDWLDGLINQTIRESQRELRYSIIDVFQMDALLLVLAAVGLIYAVIKKDYFILLWAFPYLIFLYFIGWVMDFNWIVLLPLLSIAVGTLIESLIKTLGSKKFIGLLPYMMISLVVIFGFVSTGMLVTSNLNTSYTDLYLFITRELEHGDADLHPKDDNQGTTIIGSHRTRALMWIPKYVFGDDVIFRDTDIPNDNFSKSVQTKKFLIVADSHLLPRLNSAVQDEADRRITKLYYNSSQTIATFIDKESSRYNFMQIGLNFGFGPFIEVSANY